MMLPRPAGTIDISLPTLLERANVLDEPVLEHAYLGSLKMPRHVSGNPLVIQLLDLCQARLADQGLGDHQIAVQPGEMLSAQDALHVSLCHANAETWHL
jgi:hypothetical protein